MYYGEKTLHAKINMCVQGGLIQLISNKIIHRWLTWIDKQQWIVAWEIKVYVMWGHRYKEHFGEIHVSKILICQYKTTTKRQTFKHIFS